MQIKREMENRKFIAIILSESGQFVTTLLESYYHVRGLSPNRSRNLVVVSVGVCGLPESDF